MKISTTAYQWSHGKAPRGNAEWLFVFGKMDYDRIEEVRSFGSGTYIQCLKRAVAAAKAEGHSMVAVCP